MTSVQTRIKQLPTEGANFVVLNGALGNTGILAYTPDTDQSKVGSFAPVSAASSWQTEAYNSFSTPTLQNISSAGSFLRDMGKTVISSNQLFRKVQYIGSNAVNGVRGPADTTTTTPGYYTFYIRLGINNGAPTGLPVARV